MCGICGFWNLNGLPAEQTLIDRMTEVLAHRGPDGRGVHLDGSLALGHRRLAILDPYAGAQPMSNEDGTVWVTYNGEIYNSPELRGQLQERGHTFRTRCDTEVLVHLWEEKGNAMVGDLEGMFAFAIWDGSKRKLFLARDRMGIKPLYYASYVGKFAFASELKSLYQDPEFPRHLKPQSLFRYFCLGYIPEPDTVFEDAHKLSPANTLSVTQRGAESPKQYWTVEFHEQPDANLDTKTQELDALMRRIVRRHLLSDVPVGAFLSGGIDSSLLVSYIKEEHEGDLHTFSIGFDEKDFDELPHAKAVARHLGVVHHHEVANPDLIKLLPQLAKQYDEPFGDSSCLPTYLVSRLAAQRVKVVLSGDGADEIFAGYDRYTMALQRMRHFRAMPRWVRKAFLPALWAYPESVRGHGILERIARGYDRHYFSHSLQKFPPGESARLLEKWSPRLSTELDDFRSYIERKDDNLLDRLQALDLATYLPGDILTKVDRASMLASLETRVPYLDHQLVAFTASLPAALRANPKQGKILIRKLACRRLPNETILRPKRGFSVPLVHWFRGPLRDFVRESLLDQESASQKFVDRNSIKRLVEQHEMGIANHSGKLWLALMFEFWCRAWLPSTLEAG